MLLEVAHHAHKHAESSGGDSGFWGTLPQWLTAVVGFFAVVLALRTYIGNAWQTKVKVARVVFCHVVEYLNINKDEPDHAVEHIQKVDKTYNREYFTPDRQNAFGGRVFGTAKEDLIRYVVEVTNFSDEPIDACCLQVLRPSSKTDVVNPDHPMWIAALAPKAHKKFVIYVPRDWPPGESAAASVRLSFTDSAGQRWDRIESDPPTKFKGKFG